ncbi:CLUMA_CG006821, isoform A [Clunio marinus]|uniref:CLUMA_CG006821, isoform A n=1 Tax=Clunio marinus TaxID=568069 RepID=A0A1J1I353_9DIPT|nr:CLUMA_CG006821, isoform A [Clunio marinus]
MKTENLTMMSLRNENKKTSTTSNLKILNIKLRNWMNSRLGISSLILKPQNTASGYFGDPKSFKFRQD